MSTPGSGTLALRPPPTFVVGTGRTGSTLLSEMLRRHPRVLSLNEFLVSLGGDAALSGAPVDGPAYWSTLARPHPAFAAMSRAGVPLPEFRYPATGRFAPGDVPALALMVLPHLTDDPDALLDRLRPVVRGWGVRPGTEHHLALFALLAEVLGRPVAVERSGHSLSWVAALHRAYPDARFVHMHRDGPDCALSMSRHGGYRAAGLATEILELTGARHIRDVDESRRRMLPPALAALLDGDGFLAAHTVDHAVPLRHYGRMWSEMVVTGLAALGELPPERCTTLSYEKLIGAPADELTRLARFLGVEAPPDWVEGCGALVDRGRGGGIARLAVDERAELLAACAPGARLMGLRAASPVR